MLWHSTTPSVMADYCSVVGNLFMWNSGLLKQHEATHSGEYSTGIKVPAVALRPFAHLAVYRACVGWAYRVSPKAIPAHTYVSRENELLLFKISVFLSLSNLTRLCYFLLFLSCFVNVSSHISSALVPSFCAGLFLEGAAGFLCHPSCSMGSFWLVLCCGCSEPSLREAKGRMDPAWLPGEQGKIRSITC